MARRARGAEVLEMAREMVARAETLEQLRQARAAVPPPDFGPSMEQTAQAIGRTPEWTCRLRGRSWPERSSATAASSPGSEPTGRKARSG